MLRIVTDNASDITVEQARSLGIDLIHLETAFEDDACPMNSEADYTAFYEKLKVCDKLPMTSRPSPLSYLDVFADAKQAGDDVLVITLSSGLSSTIESAFIAKEMAEYDHITIIDSQQAVMSQRILTEHAVKLRAEGKSLAEIEAEVLALRERVTVVGIIGSMVYLKKGGRVPPALALIGDALGIKPIITVKDKVIQSIGKARGMKAGVAAAYRHIESHGVDEAYPVCFGYTSNRELGEGFMQDTLAKFNIAEAALYQVGGIIGTHLGTDSVGVAFVSKTK